MKAVGKRLQAKIKWKQKRNFVSKDLFSIIKLNLSITLIFGLKDEDGNVISKKEDLEVVYCNFYINMYQVIKLGKRLGNKQNWKKGVKINPRKFSNNLNVKLVKLIQWKNEIHGQK
jgi:hypothetical protein